MNGAINQSINYPILATALLSSQYLSEGAFIYDVRTEGGGGVSPKEDVVREVA